MMRPGFVIALTFALSATLHAQNPRHTGVFRDGPGDYIVIAPLGRSLLLAETRTEQLRILFPGGTDTLRAGPAIAQPTPVEQTLVFATPDTLTIQRSGAPQTRTYPRIQIASQAVEFPSGDVTLKGTLLTRANLAGKHAAIVMVHGSENNDRNSFGPLPWVFAAHGYAVLIYDKRGTGTSTGSWQTAGIEPLAADLARAVEMLARRPDIDATRIGVVGVSEGGWVAAHAASSTARIRAILAISGGARTKGDAYVYKHRRLALEAGLGGTQLDSVIHAATLTIAESQRRVAMDSATVTGFDRRVTYDPTHDWQQFRGAFMYLGGAADVLEDAVAAGKWFEELFRSSRHPDFTIKVMPGAHHSLLHAVRGTPSEFASLDGVRELVPGYWSVVLRWLDARLTSRHAP